MTAPGDEQRYVIQIERPKERLTLDGARALLEPLGVKVDLSYGPVAVNPQLGHFVVRGLATPETRAAAESVPGVRFFADAKISPVGR